MTNAEAAAHFASLQPDQKAEVALVNLDTGSVNVYDLEKVDSADELDNIDSQEAADAVGKAAILMKW